MRQELLPRWEYWLHEGATLGLWLAVALRVARGFVFTRQLWLQDSEIAGVCLLLALLYIAGCLAPRSYSGYFTAALGSATWLAAFSLIPRFGWPRWVLPLWLLILCGVILLAAIMLRMTLQRYWLAQLGGHGFQWMRLWAEPRAYYARLTARRALRSLGYSA